MNPLGGSPERKPTPLENPGRRSLLRGRIGNEPPPLRPPWAITESAFLRACTRCDQCRVSCETGIIKRGDGGFPEIEFDTGGCTFCAACLQVCETEALQQCDPPWRLKASVRPDCLSRNGVVCRSCGELCDTRAIRFQLQPGGRATPRIDLDLCNGCGQCLSVCPTRSIELTPFSEES